MMDCWRKRTVLEKKCLVAFTVSLVAITIITLIVVFSGRDYCRTPSCTKSSERILSLIDFSQNPCSNFYNFVCGNFMSDDRSGVASIIEGEKTKSVDKLKAIILEPIGVGDSKSLRLQKQFYQSCTNLTAIDADNDGTFWHLITDLGGWPVAVGNDWNESAFDLVELTVGLRKAGLQHDCFLDVSVYSAQGANIILEINVPDNANKIEGEMRQSYVDLMTEIAIAFGAHDHVAKAEMQQVMFFENKLADLAEEMENQNEHLYGGPPELMTIGQVQATWQKVNWLGLLGQITNKKLSEDQQVVFFVAEYLPKLDHILKLTTKRTQVNYVMWKLIEAYAPFLSRRVREPVANYKKLSTNRHDRWYEDRDAYCFEESKSFFQYALEAAYLRRYVGRQKRRNVEEMVERIQTQLENHLIKAKWMDDKTRKAAILKLQNISFIIGGPEEMYYVEQFDKYIGVGNIEFNSSNIIEISTEILAKGLDFTYDRKQRGHEDYIKHSFYQLVPSLETRFLRDYNLLYIPAGVLHELFYDDRRPRYLNYAAIGTIIGHELTHGFDTGVFGNNTWWSNSTFDNFHAAIRCLLNCTDGLDENHVEMNCFHTLLENMADYTGINLSYEAYQQWLKENGGEVLTLPGLDFSSNQMFWLGYGSLMCHVPVTELNYSRYNHMLPSYRIIGSFRNSFYFGKDFNCEPGSNMNPHDKCQIL